MTKLFDMCVHFANIQLLPLSPFNSHKVLPSLEGLFALGSEGPDDAVKVCRCGDDNHLRIGHGGVIHDADAIGEALTGSRLRRFFEVRGRVSSASRFSRWRLILLEWQLSSSEDQRSPWVPSHGHQIIENAPWCSLVFCIERTQRPM